MGVGAVFISTLAIHRLDEPTDPPITQEDYLALTLQPIIAFVVLASIIIRTSKPLLVASLVTNFYRRFINPILQFRKERLSKCLPFAHLDQSFMVLSRVVGWYQREPIRSRTTSYPFRNRCFSRYSRPSRPAGRGFGNFSDWHPHASSICRTFGHEYFDITGGNRRDSRTKTTKSSSFSIALTLEELLYMRFGDRSLHRIRNMHI